MVPAGLFCICCVLTFRVQTMSTHSESSTELATSNTDAQSIYSTFYEQLVEHIFLAELLQEAWLRHGKMIEVLRAEIDASGYDLVLECNGVLRHVQLKTSRVGGKTANQKISILLADKPGGCVVWMVRDEDTTSCRIKLQYLFLGCHAGREKLGGPEFKTLLQSCKTATHTKGDATGKKKDRPNIRVVPKGKFEPAKSGGMNMHDLLYALFGLRNTTYAEVEAYILAQAAKYADAETSEHDMLRLGGFIKLLQFAVEEGLLEHLTKADKASLDTLLIGLNDDDDSTEWDHMGELMERMDEMLTNNQLPSQTAKLYALWRQDD